MEISIFHAWLTKKAVRTILIIGSICAVMFSCAYRLYWYTPSDLTDTPHAVCSSSIQSQATMEIIYADEITRTPPSKARLLFLELQTNPNFQRALENPQAQENIDRLLNHPEVERKLNSWYAIAIRKVIHSRVNDPHFPESIANPQYVDDLFKEYGIV